MTKHEEREKLLQLIFMLDFHDGNEVEEQMELFRRLHMPLEQESFIKVSEKARKLLAKVGEIDVTLTRISTGWPLNRLGKAELSIMRIAAYEIMFDEEIPDSVAINEAVELSKAYGSDSAPSFVNGVLGKLVKKSE